MPKSGVNTRNMSYKVDILVLISLVLLGYMYSLLMNEHFVGRAVFGMGAMVLPSVVYLSIRKPKPWRKIMLAVATFGTLYGLFFEFIQEYNQAYTVLSRVFPKLLGVVPFDNIMGHMMMAALIFVFYEHFMVRKIDTKISPRYVYGVALGAIALVVTVALFYLAPIRITFDYSYALLGAAALLPLMVFIWRKPSQIGSLLAPVPFFFFLFYLIETVAVRYSWWVYPASHYLGYVSLGATRFPFEELFFWMLLYAPALISYYKLFLEKTDW